MLYKPPGGVYETSFPGSSLYLEKVPWGPFLESPEKVFGPVKPFLDHLYLKTEKCILLKLLV